MNNEARIKELKEKYTNKKLSREERREAFRALTRELYKRDPRKPISYRKQNIFNAIIILLMFISFTLMGISEYLDLNMTDHSLHNAFFAVIIVSLGISLVVGIYINAKFKNEPEDELAQKNMSRAASMGTAITTFALLIASFVYFNIFDNETFIIKRSFAVFFAASFITFSAFLNRVIFLILEGKDEPEEEE